MTKQPAADEFEVSDAGVTHVPSGATFAPYPGHPTEGTMHDGYEKEAAEYDPETVKEMMRRLWAKHLSGKLK